MHRFKIIMMCFLACTGSIYGSTEKIIINRIDLIGNKHVSVNEILFIVRQRPTTFFYRQPEFNSRLLKLDALTLKNYYHSKGFLDVKIKESHKINNSKADIIFEIDEGKRYFLNKLKINGNDSISDQQISELLGLSIGAPYNPVVINESLYLLENEYYNKGKLFFNIEIKDFIKDSVEVLINIEENKDVYINDTFFEKTGNIDSAVVWRELTYKKGDLYTKKETDRTLKQLREMGIFSMANMVPVKVANSDSLVNLVIEFRRYKQREWYSTGGYDPISFAEGSPELPALSATIEWRNRATFNTPKQFSTKLLAGIPMETDFVTPRIRYDASFSSNWFFNIRIPTTITGYFERFIIYEDQKYNKSIDRFGANLVQRFQLQNRSFIDNKIVWEEFSDKSETNIQERSILSRIYLDYKDDPLYTKKGYLLDLIFKSTVIWKGGEIGMNNIQTDTSIGSTPLDGTHKSNMYGQMLARVWEIANTKKGALPKGFGVREGVHPVIPIADGHTKETVMEMTKAEAQKCIKAAYKLACEANLVSREGAEHSLAGDSIPEILNITYPCT